MIEWQDLGPRSLLFVPGDMTDRLLLKAEMSGADGVVLDLEDAVLPEAKDAARQLAVSALAGAKSATPVLARVNSVNSPWFSADVAGLVGTHVAGLILPKCESAEDIGALGSLLRDESVAIIPIIETARGVLAAEGIGGADPRVVGLAFGAEDLGAQMGLRRTRSGREVLHARSHVVLAAAAAGRWAIDSPCIEPHNVEATRREAVRARTLGYAGKLLIHPAQVMPVHEGFAPSASEVQAAKEIVAAFNSMGRAGSGVRSHAGRMIDRPIVDAAQRLLARAGRDNTGGSA